MKSDSCWRGCEDESLPSFAQKTKIPVIVMTQVGSSVVCVLWPARSPD